MPFIMDDAQRGITVLHRIGNDAHGEQVVHLIERDLLPLQLLKHGIRALLASIDARRNTLARQQHLNRVLDLF